MSGMTSPSYNQNFVQETIVILSEFLTDIITECLWIGEYLPDQDYFWNTKVSRLTSSIGQFVELTTLLSKSIFQNQHIFIPTIKDSHIRLLSILKAMNQALTKHDYVALEELIKYELKDNLTQWKIDIIPQIKKHLKA